MRWISASVALLLASAGELAAQGKGIRFWNLTTATISGFQLSPAGKDSWGSRSRSLCTLGLSKGQWFLFSLGFLNHGNLLGLYDASRNSVNVAQFCRMAFEPLKLKPESGATRICDANVAASFIMYMSLVRISRAGRWQDRRSIKRALPVQANIGRGSYSKRRS